MKSNGKMLGTSLSMTESFRPKMARPGAFLSLVRKFVALFAATAFLFAFTSCSSDSGGGSDDNPATPPAEEITDVQKKAEGTYTIGETTYTVKDGKVTVTDKDGTSKEVGEISKEGVITIKQDDGTTTEITATTDKDGKTTTTVKIETKKEDGSTETKTYTGDLSTGTLTNKDNPNDTMEVKKTEPEKTDPENPDKPNQDNPSNPGTTDPANPDNPNKPEDPNTDPKQDDPQENPNPENPKQDDPKEDPKTDEPENPEEPKPENPDEPENPEPEKPEPSATAGSIEVSIDSKAKIIVEPAVTDTTITLTAEDGFTGYTWLIDDGKKVTEFDGAELSADGRILTLTRKSLTKDAKYPVSLLAIKNGIPYSANILVKNVTDRN